ncbi:MAG: AAA family ATPase [Dehalococcoidia bacterium]|nr:AAA family ATPase [Dehalococcoidia bacterium]
MRTIREKEVYTEAPSGIVGSSAESLWNNLLPEQNDRIDTNISANSDDRTSLDRALADNCFLYFPADRFELPAWLNRDALEEGARHMDLPFLSGHTGRRVFATSPLQANRDWLYDVVYDRAAFEIQTRSVNVPGSPNSSPQVLPLFTGYWGEATRVYDSALTLVRTLTRRGNARFGIGRRQHRVVSLLDGDEPLTPNIFQLSSGELSLLNIGLSILRDYDLTRRPFESLSDITGLVLIDEIDLHLHSSHQYEVLPSLLSLFPSVQFIVTTHSPLFVLGMKEALGEEGFSIYRLPESDQISPEQFTEFGHAYASFTSTRLYSEDMARKIKDSQRPILFVEGSTDKQYLEAAAIHLDRAEQLAQLEIWEGGGKGSLRKLWDSYTGPVARAMPQDVVLLFDCDAEREPLRKGRIVQRTIRRRSDNPIADGIENLFSRPVLERAREANPAFVDIDEARRASKRGQWEDIPETWTVNSSEKSNLCRWLCENGTAADFEGFHDVFDLLEEALATSADNE